MFTFEILYARLFCAARLETTTAASRICPALPIQLTLYRVGFPFPIQQRRRSEQCSFCDMCKFGKRHCVGQASLRKPHAPCLSQCIYTKLQVLAERIDGDYTGTYIIFRSSESKNTGAVPFIKYQVSGRAVCRPRLPTRQSLEFAAS